MLSAQRGWDRARKRTHRLGRSDSSAQTDFGRPRDQAREVGRVGPESPEHLCQHVPTHSFSGLWFQRKNVFRMFQGSLVPKISPSQHETLSLCQRSLPSSGRQALTGSIHPPANRRFARSRRRKNDHGEDDAERSDSSRVVGRQSRSKRGVLAMVLHVP